MPVLYSSGGASGSMELALPPNPATNLVAKGGNAKVSLTWTDPEDRQEGSKSIWDHSVLIRKQGSAPTSVLDGTKVLESSVRNQYSENTYVDTKVSNGTEYFYAVYTYSTEGAISKTAPIISTTPKATRVMTVKIDLNDSNPETCGSYADDAIKMPNGKTDEAIMAWQEFFGYRPCLFKDGQVVGYLNPNDYTKFENGTPADITSGNAGDVMVEFPRRGVKISKSKKIITVSLTDEWDDPDFTYYAHSRGNQKKDYFYLGAYLADISYGNKDLLRSISGVQPQGSVKLVNHRQYAHNRGSGYEVMTFYQWIYIQAMYLLQFKGNLNSQRSVGSGYYTPDNKKIVCGSLNKSKLIHGVWGGYYRSIKLFGLEDLWGEFACFIDGCWITYVSIDKWCIHTATDNLSDVGKYVKQLPVFDCMGINGTLHVGYMTDATSTSESGFLPLGSFDIRGSDSTYFCDNIDIDVDSNYKGFLLVGEDSPRSISDCGIFTYNRYDYSPESDIGYDGIYTYSRLSYY